MRRILGAEDTPRAPTSLYPASPAAQAAFGHGHGTAIEADDRRHGTAVHGNLASTGRARKRRSIITSSRMGLLRVRAEGCDYGSETEGGKHVDREEVFQRLEKILATVKINPAPLRK